MPKVGETAAGARKPTHLGSQYVRHMPRRRTNRLERGAATYAKAYTDTRDALK